MSIHTTTLGHVVFRTRDLARSLAFYRDVLGLEAVATEQFGGQRWFFLTTGRTHHDLALVEDAAADGMGRLDHVGFKVGDSIEQLLEAKRDLERRGIEVIAAMDFTVSQALFLVDPDGTTIELYVDTPGAPWRADPTLVASATPLEL